MYEKVFGKTKTMGLVGNGYRDYDSDYVFATRDTLSRDEHLYHYKPNDFNCIILDEAHHSAAQSYQKIMNYFKPELWLGMTATPDKREYGEEKNIYEALLIDKNNFKNPESIKVIYVKYCNNQYSIVGITANNSYGPTISETYFKNKNVFSTDNNAIKTVSEECFKIETESYNKVKVLSKTALTRINNKLNRGTK